ncbi:TetR/AcrR family transcriptional regulator [Paraburkholderia rhizosphaerae]|uniref:TetR family transcriptional regulator n=1 Tax=Paraburkholderia rhizosphaerae TaxID=480658 RepID=A0A4R8L5J3_9BURK|nr:TetR/AcrR family transcriptional regulator [Paraburkholderia rhizosphaerae]TDY37080.1 TetR family transcriptional regulator [Paraburkholderia rhizosphaerae]
MSKPIVSKKLAYKPAAECPRGRPRQFDTNAVLAKAAKVFWNHGYHATSIDDLVKATGVLRGSLYGVFGDKHGLMLAALEHYAEGSIAGLVERLNADVPPADALRNALMHHTHVAAALAGQRSCFIVNSTLEMQVDDEALRAKLASIQRRIATLLAAAVIRGQAAGVFNPTLDEKSVADYLLCMTQGLRVMGRVKRNEDELAAIVDIAMRALTR